MKSSKIILSAMLTLVLCVALISGATFALFTSSSEVNIAVTSGKVQVAATAEIVSAWSAKSVDGSYVRDTELRYEGGVYTFTDGGTASMTGSNVTLAGIMPGDGALIKVTIDNTSNVTIKYKVIVVKGESSGSYAEGGLFEGLSKVISTDEAGEQALPSGWQTATVGADIADVYVSLELPVEATNEYQDQFCTLTVSVQAMQGNAGVNEFNPATSGQLRNSMREGANPYVELQSNVNSGADFTLKPEQYSQTLDLNGHILRGTFHAFGFDPETVYDHDADIYIRNGSIVTSSEQTGGSYGFGIALFGMNVGTAGAATVTLHLDNVNVYGSWCGFSTNGAQKGVKVIANNCTFEGGQVGAYLPAGIEYEFNNCRFVGQTGICIRGGKVTLNNCTIEGNDIGSPDDLDYVRNSSYDANGSAILIYGGDGPEAYSDVYLTINGGKLISAERYAIEDCCGLPFGSSSGSTKAACRIKAFVVKDVEVDCPLGNLKRYTLHETDGWDLPDGWLD